MSRPILKSKKPTTSQRAMASAKLANVRPTQERRSGTSAPNPAPLSLLDHASGARVNLRITKKQAARTMKVSTGAHDRARAVLRLGSPALVKAVEEGRITVEEAWRAAKGDGRVPPRRLNKTPRVVSDDWKIERSVNSLSTVSGFLMTFMGSEVKAEWIKSLTESRRNISRFLKGAGNEGHPVEVQIQDRKPTRPGPTVPPEGAAVVS